MARRALRLPMLALLPLASGLATQTPAPRPIKQKKPIILEKRAWQVACSGGVSAAVLGTLYSTASRTPPLLAVHVACMAPMLPLGTAAVSTVRQRMRPAPAAPANAPPHWRKQRAEWLVVLDAHSRAHVFCPAMADQAVPRRAAPLATLEPPDAASGSRCAAPRAAASRASCEGSAG